MTTQPDTTPLPTLDEQLASETRRADGLQAQLVAAGITPQGLRQRPGDQTLPDITGRPSMQRVVMEDLAEREQLGIQRYGAPLTTFNGRKTLRDVYDELLDGAVYARSLLAMSETATEDLTEVLTPKLGGALAGEIAVLVADYVVTASHRLAAAPAASAT